MTREEFIKYLESSRCSYKMEGDKIIVTRGEDFSDGDFTAWVNSLPTRVEFRNRGDVLLSPFIILPPGVEFNNTGGVRIRGWFDDWEGNIEGIDPKRLLNKMIKQGVFER